MKNTPYVLLCLTAFVSANAYADGLISVQSSQKQYTSDDVITLFGSSKTYTQPKYNQQNWSVDVNANLKTNLDCGKIQLSTDIQSTIDQLARIPQELKDNLSSDMTTLEAAAPLMAVCWTDPVICAELKNLDLNLNTNIGLETNSCHAINNFVNDQASKGKLEAYNKTLNQCIAQNTNANGGNALAVRKQCEIDTDPNNVLVTDIVNHQMNTTLHAAQNIMLSAVQSAGHYVTQDDQDVYQILNASIGELSLNVDGSVTPVLPPGNTTLDPLSLSQNFLYIATNISCDTNNAFGNAVASLQSSTSSDSATRYMQNAVYKSINRNFTSVDATNLSEIDPMDRKILCQVLGRSIAQYAIQTFSSAGLNQMSAVTQNTYVPQDVRNTYQQKTGIFFSTLEKQLNTEEVFPIPVVRKEIANLARSAREENRALGSEISSENRKSSQWWNLTDMCNSVYTCQ